MLQFGHCFIEIRKIVKEFGTPIEITKTLCAQITMKYKTVIKAENFQEKDYFHVYDGPDFRTKKMTKNCETGKEKFL